MIPKIIHQSWKDGNIPCKWQGYQDSWKALHPSYHYMLHTDEDNLRLVTEFYPEFLELYNAYKYPVKLTRVYNEEAVKPDLLPSIVFSPITRNELKKRRNFGEAAYVMSELPADTLGIHHFYGSWI